MKRLIAIDNKCEFKHKHYKLIRTSCNNGEKVCISTMVVREEEEMGEESCRKVVNLGIEKIRERERS